MSTVMLDASVMVALFDDADRHHEDCVARLSALPLGTPLWTTWPCITEASYLLAPRNHLALLSWVHKGAADVAPLAVEDLPPLITWMNQYTEAGKTLMDLADASLVWAAVQKGARRILTLDERGFLRYRLPDGQALQVV